MLSLTRIGKVGSQKRVVGVLLGSWHKKVLDVSNSFAGELNACVQQPLHTHRIGPQARVTHQCLYSFAVPFDEDDKDDSVWFLDHDYLENMYGMFKKVNGMLVL